MLADNMKAYEYFKFLIEVKKENPLTAFEEVLSFIKVNDYNTQKAVAEAQENFDREKVLERFHSYCDVIDLLSNVARDLSNEYKITEAEISSTCTCPDCLEEKEEYDYEKYIRDNLDAYNDIEIDLEEDE